MVCTLLVVCSGCLLAHIVHNLEVNYLSRLSREVKLKKQGLLKMVLEEQPRFVSRELHHWKLLTHTCTNTQIFHSRAVPDSGFVNPARAGFVLSNPAGARAGFVICSWYCSRKKQNWKIKKSDINNCAVTGKQWPPSSQSAR